MSHITAPGLVWFGVLTNLKKISLERGILCYSKLYRAGKASPWLYFFDILTDKKSQFCFLKNDRQYQDTVLSFMEENATSIPKYLLKRFSHNLSSEEDLERFKTHFKDEVRADVAGTVSEYKRRLSSPVLPDSKHVCLDRPRSPEKLVSTDVVMIEDPIISITEEPMISITEDSRISMTKDSDIEKPTVTLLSVEELLLLEDTQLISHLAGISQGCDSKQFLDVSYKDLNTVFNRVKNSPVALQNFISAVVIPFLAGKKVCTRNDSSIISECLECDYINHVSFVTDILKTCRKQIIGGTAKIVILKPTKLDNILSGFSDLLLWNEDITAFLVLVVTDTCSVAAIGKVLQYLVINSDEKSSKSCSLVMQILASYSKHEIIVELCSQFADRSKCFLKKALQQKLDNILDC